MDLPQALEKASSVATSVPFNVTGCGWIQHSSRMYQRKRGGATRRWDEKAQREPFQVLYDHYVYSTVVALKLLVIEAKHLEDLLS